jgi:hypothetical protein
MPHLARIFFIVPFAYSFAIARFICLPSGSPLRVAIPSGALSIWPPTVWNLFPVYMM